MTPLRASPQVPSAAFGDTDLAISARVGGMPVSLMALDETQDFCLAGSEIGHGGSFKEESGLRICTL
jgi:hypothetical protein